MSGLIRPYFIGIRAFSMVIYNVNKTDLDYLFFFNDHYFKYNIFKLERLNINFLEKKSKIIRV